MPTLPKSSVKDTSQEKRIGTGISTEDYINRKPELPIILSLMKSEALAYKPDDLALFFSDVFFKPGNIDRLIRAFGS